ncbi:hypothetical protein GCM10027317_17700 [Massilia agri]
MQLDLDKVLEDIGVVTRVEGVAVAQHKLEFLRRESVPGMQAGEIAAIIHYIALL